MQIYSKKKAEKHEKVESQTQMNAKLHKIQKYGYFNMYVPKEPR